MFRTHFSDSKLGADILSEGFPGGTSGRESTCNAGDLF